MTMENFERGLHVQEQIRECCDVPSDWRDLLMYQCDYAPGGCEKQAKCAAWMLEDGML